ncbi:hypothetical protein HERIO_2521 [Hepatospora eriocheir]|uniref:Uncharacterized protein n=1 Tax=Hepatospora eriocheir TaxID=1081669 RepID=A0A1X0Q6M0_9MICR|nr:hypothetical protein HERIO_2521 [Hepatospora eriocheir]
MIVKHFLIESPKKRIKNDLLNTDYYDEKDIKYNDSPENMGEHIRHRINQEGERELAYQPKKLF